MKKNYKRLRELAKSSPSLLMYENAESISYINNKFCEHWAVEIETKTNNPETIEALSKRFLGLCETDCDCSELRFRFEPGVSGLVAAEKVSNLLRGLEVKENPKSGNHYHVNVGAHVCKNISTLFEKRLTDVTDLNTLDFREYPGLKKITSSIIKELECWNYKGQYNNKAVMLIKTAWVVFRENFSTIEFRIGEMSIDHTTWIHRVMHCQSIVKRFQDFFVNNSAQSIIKKYPEYYRQTKSNSNINEVCEPPQEYPDGIMPGHEGLVYFDGW